MPLKVFGLWDLCPSPFSSVLLPLMSTRGVVPPEGDGGVDSVHTFDTGETLVPRLLARLREGRGTYPL